MSGLFASAKPYRIKAAHRRRRKCASGPSVQRYYDPGIGRFLSVDPVTANGNTGGNFNRYKYANNNPYRFTDPDGRQEMSAEEIDNAREENRGIMGAPLLEPISPASMAESSPSLVPDSLGEMRDSAEAAGKALEGEIESGSYTNYHESGKTYDGKGPESRSRESARKVERQAGDRHVRTDHTTARNSREGFKQESRRLDSHGGPKSPNNYNKIESPGKNMRQADGEIPKPPPPPPPPPPTEK